METIITKIEQGMVTQAVSLPDETSAMMRTVRAVRKIARLKNSQALRRMLERPISVRAASERLSKMRVSEKTSRLPP